MGLREPVNFSTVDQVMLQFQESMVRMSNGFLQTQEHVMLAYLRNTDTTVGTIPIGPSQLVSPVVRAKLVPAAPQTMIAPPIELRDEGLPQARLDEPTPVAPNDDANQLAPSASAQERLPDRESLVSDFIDLVSQRTGYPVEMLDPTLDLESDLGIDSIKRVEIFGQFRRLLPESMYEEFEGRLEELAGLGTLNGISDWIRNMPHPVQDPCSQSD
jgi:hypothetical protein